MNLNSTIDLDVSKFFRWWAKELAFLVPERWQQAFSDHQGILLVTPQGQELQLTYTYKDRSKKLATLPRNETGSNQYKELLAKHEKLSKARIAIRLSAKEAIQKELSLPLVAKENLQQVIAYELDRYTPFKAEHVYFAVYPIQDSAEPDQLRVMLVIALRETVDALLEDVKNIGMIPEVMDTDAAPNNFEERREHYNLLPLHLRPKTPYWPRVVHGSLIAILLGLLATTLIMPVWLQYRSVASLERQVNKIEKEAKKVNALQAEMDAITQETKHLLAEKENTPAMVVVLDTLSHLIKDNTWLAYAQYSEKQLQMQGESPNASTLISVLEASDAFTNARFVSPVTQDTVSKLERFQITVDVTPAGGISGGSKK